MFHIAALDRMQQRTIVTRCLWTEAVETKVHPLYERGYVISCVGNLTEENICVWISHGCMNTGNMLKIQTRSF
jgi:hypothetical protein